MPFSGADLERGMGSLVNHCATQYSAFSWDKEEQKLMDTLLSKCEDAGLTCSRVYFVRSRIGFRALSKMLFYTLSGLPSHRSRQTTMALQACFAAVCFASLGCRVGDLSLSKGYSGEECLQYKDISVVVNAQYGYLTDIQRHVSIDVTLRAEKGHKRDSSKRVIRIGLLPLTPHVDFITHLLVHAARHGAIAPDLSVNAVLKAAATEAGGKLRWMKQGPVFVNVKHGLLTDQALSAKNLSLHLDQISRDSGLLVRFTSHEFRRGCHFRCRYSERQRESGAACYPVQHSLLSGSYCCCHSRCEYRSAESGTPGAVCCPGQHTQSWCFALCVQAMPLVHRPAQVLGFARPREAHDTHPGPSHDEIHAM